MDALIYPHFLKFTIWCVTLRSLNIWQLNHTSNKERSVFPEQINSMHNNIRIILVNPSHPGNIGAAARAMKNMGLQHLYLVAPQKFPHPEAIYRASRADDIVQNAVVTKTLDEALQGCTYVFGTSTREREMSAPLIDVRAMSKMIMQQCQQQAKIAILFGREKYGLYNDELRRCQFQVKIPTVKDYSSLNLAAAVQVVAYELYVDLLNKDELSPVIADKKSVAKATAGELEGLYRHLETAMIKIGFLHPEKPRMMMPRFRQIFNRADLSKDDVDLLRGMLRKIYNES
jgi:TrmH family RNA methyltransferase